VLIYCYEVLGVCNIAELSRALNLSVYEQATLFEEFRHYTVAQSQEREHEIKEAFAEYVACSSIPKLAFNMATGPGKTTL